MANPRFAYTPEIATTIKSLAGSYTSVEIAAAIGAPSAVSVKSWARDHGVSLRRPPSQSPVAIYANLRQIAHQKGLRLSMAGKRVTLWVPFRAHMTVNEAETFLRGYRPLMSEAPPPLRGRRLDDSFSDGGVASLRAHRFTEEELADIGALAAQGFGASEIGRRLGRSPGAIRRVAERAGITLSKEVPP